MPSRKTNSKIKKTISEQEEEINDISVIKPKKFSLSKKQIALFALGAIILLSGYLLKNYLIVATVNGQIINRIEFDRELEKQGGKQILESKITELLIISEAKKKNLNPTVDEIDNRFKQLEDQFTSQGQKIDDLLAQQGQTRENLKKQISLQLIVEKAVGQDIEITDKEINDYLTSYYPKGTKLEEKKEEIISSLKQQKLSEKAQGWLEEIKKSASINYNLTF